ncbi:MAG: RidA family protein [Sneathiella sp.]|nr:RidA family protein [Sneathiella sp.]
MTLPLNPVIADEKAQLKIVNPAGLYDPAPNGYSHAVIATNINKAIFIAGQGGEDSSGILSTSFEAQVKQAYANLEIAIEAAGAKPDQVLKITTYVAEYEQEKLGIMSKYLNETFKGWLPAQTLVPVPRLALDGMLFEVDAYIALSE